MFRKIATSAVLAATLATGFVTPAEARRHYRDGYYQQYDRGHYRHRGYGRGYGRCYDKGNGGLAIGAVAGGLLGNQVAGRGDRLLGTVLGAGVGGLAGRAIDKSDGRRC